MLTVKIVVVKFTHTKTIYIKWPMSDNKNFKPLAILQLLEKRENLKFSMKTGHLECVYRELKQCHIFQLQLQWTKYYFWWSHFLKHIQEKKSLNFWDTNRNYVIIFLSWMAEQAN